VWAEDIGGAQRRGWKGWSGDTRIAIYRIANASMSMLDLCEALIVERTMASVEFTPADLEQVPETGATWRRFFLEALPLEHDFKVPRGRTERAFRLVRSGNLRITIGETLGRFTIVIYQTS
jgi:hypothetical protein